MSLAAAPAALIGKAKIFSADQADIGEDEMKFRIPGSLPLLALLLASCSQSNSPSEKVEQVGEDIVSAAKGGAPSEETELGAFAPRDECSELAGADLFMQRLALAVEARDAEGVAALAAKDVKLDFGGGAGRAQLIEMLSDPESDMWGELETLGQLGCAPSDGGITLPWYFAQNIPVDAYEGMIVTGDSVPFLKTPADDGEEIARLDWDAVEVIGSFDPSKPYQKVAFDEEEGFVATNKLRSIIDYRLIASSRNGLWRITSLVAGD